MAVRWQISFKTLPGRDGLEHDGLVKIYDSTYTGDVIELEPAGSAFSTTSQSSDFFQPVMSESGYLRIIDSDNPTDAIGDLYPIGALDRPVEFYLDNTLQWRGYISPEEFTVDWGPAPRELALPLVGTLSVLSSVNIQETTTDTQSIAAFIKEILTATGFSWSNVILARQMQSIGTYDVLPELRLSLSRYRFVRYNTAQNTDEPDWTKYVGESYLGVLERICEYFGWTACQKGADLILLNSRLDMVTAGFNSITWSDLTSLSSNPLAVITPTAVTRPVSSLLSLGFDGINHRRSRNSGRRKVTVETDVKQSESAFPRLWFNGTQIAYYQHIQTIKNASDPSIIMDYMYGRVKFLTPIHENVTLYRYYWDASRSSFVRAAWAPVTGDVFEVTPRADVVRGFTFDKSLESDPDPDDDYKKYLRLCLHGQISSGSGSGSGGNQYAILPLGSLLAEIESGESCLFTGGGALCFSAQVLCNYYDTHYNEGDEDGLTQAAYYGGDLLMSVEIGGMYYDGSGWSDNPTILSVECASSNGKVKDNNNGRYKNAVGYVMPIADSMTGRIRVTFYAWNSSSAQYNTLFLRDIAVQYYNDAITDSESINGVHIAQLTGQAFKDDKTTNLVISSLGSEQPLVVSSCYMLWQGTPIGQDNIFTYADEDESEMAQPEYWLMDSMCKAYANPSAWLELEVSLDDILPYSVLTWEGKNYLVMSVDADYSDYHAKLRIASYE